MEKEKEMELTAAIFVAFAKEKYDSWPQSMCYLGIYDNINKAKEQIQIHKSKKYHKFCEEYDYFIFTSFLNETVKMEEHHCVYALTSKMGEEYSEFIDEKYKMLLHNKSYT